MAENDEETVKEFGRLLISKKPNRRTLLTLFQHLKLYIVEGRDSYWKRYSEILEESLPDSQHKFWDYQEIFERYTHPSRRYCRYLKEEEIVRPEEDLVPLSKEEEALLANLLE